MSLQELASEVERAKTLKANLEAAKAKNAKTFTEQQQNELNSVTLWLVDAEEVLAQKEADAVKEAAEAKEPAKVQTSGAYIPAPGTEKLIHVQLVRGNRFDPKTGEEKVKPYAQLFSYGEFMLFSKNYKRLGFDIVKVLHDPYSIAKANIG